MEYSFSCTRKSEIEPLFEAFGLTPDDSVALFTPSEDKWKVRQVYAADGLLDSLNDGDRLIWVKEGITHLPGIQERTGE